MGVAANPKASRQNQKPNGKTKNLTAKPKISRQNQKPHAAKPKPHGKTKNPTRQTKNLTPKPNRATGKVKYFDRKSHKKCQKLSNFMVNTSSVNSSYVKPKQFLGSPDISKETSNTLNRLK